MDRYEELLEEKIFNAKVEYIKAVEESKSKMEETENNRDYQSFVKDIDDILSKNIRTSMLLGEIEAYQDALVTYRNLKMKGEI